MAVNCIVLPRDGVVFAHGELDRALGRLKRTLAQAGVTRTLRDKAFYRKPSEQKRIKAKRARTRVLRAERKSAARHEWYGRQIEDMKKRKGVMS